MICCEGFVVENGRCLGCFARVEEEVVSDRCCPNMYLAVDRGMHVCTGCGRVEEMLETNEYTEVTNAESARVTHYGGGVPIKGLPASKWNIVPIKSDDAMLMEVDAVISQYDLSPEIRHLSSGILSRLQKSSSMWKGKQRRTIAVSLMYHGLKGSANPRSVAELAALTKIPLKKLNSVVRFVAERLADSGRTSSIDPSLTVTRYASRLGARRATIVLAKRVAFEERDRHTAGIQTLVGASILYACHSLDDGRETAESRLSTLLKVRGRTIRALCERIEERRSQPANGGGGTAGAAGAGGRPKGAALTPAPGTGNGTAG